MKVGDIVEFRGHLTVQDGTEATIVQMDPTRDGQDAICEVWVSGDRYDGPAFMASLSGLGDGRVRVKFMASGVKNGCVA